jgi:hypothetical protein
MPAEAAAAVIWNRSRNGTLTVYYVNPFEINEKSLRKGDPFRGPETMHGIRFGELIQKIKSPVFF